VLAAVERARAAACCLVLVAAVFVQDPGLTAADTKLDLTVDPVGLLRRALHLWDPQGGAGQLQNQAYGYLFPLGPYYAVAHGLGVPAWVAQRGWQSAVLVLAFLGVRALARRLEIGTATTRLLGAAVFALTPRLLTTVGPTSVEALPTALAPWVLLPLVGASALVRPRRAAAASGVALACVGGVNAAATLAVLPLCVGWLASRPAGRGRRRLAGWWALAVVLAVLWWAAPLVVLGRYSPPFLDVIESAATTTSVTALLPVLSGTSDWVGWLAGSSGPQWRAGFFLVHAPVAVLDVALLAAGGVAGLCRRDLPHRRTLAGAAVLGAVLVTAGHGGALAAPWAGQERGLLDGALAAFRNTHKYDVVLRLPLVLGLVHLAAQVRTPALGAPRRPVPIGWRPLVTAGTALLAAPVALLTAVALAGVALPMASRQLEVAGAYPQLSVAWRETADWLAAHDDGGRALLLPATSHAQQVWGTTSDEPLQPLARTAWVTRDAVPLGGPAVTRVLDAVQAQVATGQGSDALAPFLARAGIRWLVVRNDLDRVATGALRPVVLHAALAGSTGLARVASFGALVGVPPREDVVVDGGLSPVYPSVEVWRVEGKADRVVALAAAGTLRVSGGPESLLPLLERGLLPADAPVILASDPVQGPVSASVATDGYRRREVDFGRPGDAVSATLSHGELARADRPVHDYLLGPPGDHQTLAQLSEVAAVRASSSASDADAPTPRGPARVPAAALDGDPSTAWLTGAGSPVGAWLDIDLGSPRQLPALTVSVPAVADLTRRPTSLVVRTDVGAVTRTLRTGPTVVRLGVRTRHLRLTVASVAPVSPVARADGADRGDRTGLEVGISGVPPVTRSLALPTDLGGATGTIVLAAAAHAGDGCVTPDAATAVCGASLVGSGEDEAALDRVFSRAAGGAVDVTATVRARGGRALDDLLSAAALAADPRVLTATASSSLLAAPAAAPGAAVDADVGTGWIAGPGDEHPTLTVRLPAGQAVRTLRLVSAASLAAARPVRVIVHAAGQRREARVEGDGTVRLWPPVVTRELALELVAAPRTDVTDAGLAALPVGVSEVTVNGMAARPPSADAAVALTCGEGPALTVDGVVVTTSVHTTRAAVVAGDRVDVTACGPAGRRMLAAGQHRVVLARTAALRPDGVTLVPVPESSPAAPPVSRPVVVQRWRAADRAVAIAPGAAVWLVVRENASAGWQARLGGVRLPAARIDGWQQGFLVPAGAGGVVRLTFAPDRPYRLGLAAGGVAALGLLVLLLAPERPGETAETAEPTRGGHPRRRAHVGRMLAGLPLLAPVLVGGLAGGLALAVALALAQVGRRLRCPVPALVAGGAVAVAGLLAAVRPAGAGTAPLALGPATQALGLLALSVLAIQAGRPRPRPADAAIGAAAGATAAPPTAARPLPPAG